MKSYPREMKLDSSIRIDPPTPFTFPLRQSSFANELTSPVCSWIIIDFWCTSESSSARRRLSRCSRHRCRVAGAAGSSAMLDHIPFFVPMKNRLLRNSPIKLTNLVYMLNNRARLMMALFIATISVPWPLVLYHVNGFLRLSESFSMGGKLSRRHLSIWYVIYRFAAGSWWIGLIPKPVVGHATTITFAGSSVQLPDADGGAGRIALKIKNEPSEYQRLIAVTSPCSARKTSRRLVRDNIAPHCINNFQVFNSTCIGVECSSRGHAG